MSTVKHSKFKNTGILFELLVRQIASDTLSKDNSEAVRIIKEYFSNKTQLGKELQLYQTILQEKFSSESQANRFIDAVLSSRRRLNKGKLRREKYNLIKEIKEHYDIEKFTKARIDNYRTLASTYTIFENTSLAPADGGAAMEARKFAPDGSKVLSEALSEPDTTSGAYFADCYTGILTTSDQENNIFTINLDGTYDLDLAGEDVEDVTTPAIVNQPIEPRLFVLDGDGYGYEYLRPSDVDEYLRKIELDCTGTISRLNPSVAIEKGFSREKKGTEAPSSSTVHTYMYDVLKRSVELSKPNCMDRPPSPDKPHVIKQDPKASLRDREVIVVRNLEEMKPLEIELRDAVLNAERDCAQWRDDREANQNRFAVDIYPKRYLNTKCSIDEVNH